MKELKINNHWQYFALILFTAIPIFAHLDSEPLRLWDESRLATNAHEMYNSGEMLVTTFQGRSEGWNTKPPLLIWLQVIAFKLLGVNELSIRLPSALAGAILMIGLLFLTRRLNLNGLVAFAASAILLLSAGYNGEHGLRYGDYDSLLTTLLFFQFVLFFLFTSEKNIESRRHYLLLTLLITLMAVLTKGIAGVLFIPAFIVWWLIHQQWKIDGFKRPIIYSVVAASLTLSYYIIREQMDPGYIEDVVNNELGGRFRNSLENHSQQFGYYIKMLPQQLGWWVWTYPILTGIAIRISAKQIRNFLLLVVLVIIFYIFVIEQAATKNFWYLMPVIPLLTYSYVVSITIILNRITAWLNISKKFGMAMYLFLLIPYSQLSLATMNTTHNVSGDDGFYNITNFIRSVWKRGNNHEWIFIDYDYSAHNWWYIDVMNQNGSDMKYYIHSDSVSVGDSVLVRQPFVKKHLEQAFVCNQIYGEYSCWLLQLTDKK